VSVTAGPSTGSGVWPARPRVGEVATVLAVVVAALGVLTGAPADPSTAGWAVGSLVLGAAFCAAAATVRRCGARGPTGPMSVLGVVLLLDAVAAAGAARAPALAVLDLRLTAAVLTLVGPALALTVPSGRLDAWPDRVAAAVVAVAGTAVVAVPSAPVALPAGIAVAVVVSGAVWARFERSRDDDRPRMLWLVYGVGVTGVVGGHVLFVAETWNGAALAVAVTVLLLCGAVLPVTLAVALVAPRWIDVRRVIAATVLAVLMVDLVLAAFTGSLAVIAALTGRPAPRLVPSLLCVVIAVGFHPVMRRVRTALDQVLFGGRPDPVGVVSSLGSELRRGGDPQRWLDTVRLAVDLPYAELIHDDRRLAVSGTATGPTTAIALWAGADRVGDLVVGMPEHHTELPRATAAVLELAAAPLARALQSTRLAEALQESRQRVVVASEEERRRLRRDLHDGLGPVLAGVAYTADAARNVLESRPEQASELLADLREDVTGAIAEVRRLVHDLRPPALDQLGLVPALRQQAARLHRPDGAAVRVTIEADVLEPLPAAVEVAAYRLVSEAMLNVARHADTTTADVLVAVRDDTLELCVRDGAAAGAPWVAGAGLTSMRERIEQLGGRLEAGGSPEGGRVRALLPLPASGDPRPRVPVLSRGPSAAGRAARTT